MEDGALRVAFAMMGDSPELALEVLSEQGIRDSFQIRSGPVRELAAEVRPGSGRAIPWAIAASDGMSTVLVVPRPRLLEQAIFLA